VNPHRAGAEPGLAGEPDPGRRVEHVEQGELVLGRWQSLLGAFDDVSPAGAAACDAAVERDRRAVRVAQIDQAAPRTAWISRIRPVLDSAISVV
jgi:hypothetical protein